MDIAKNVLDRVSHYKVVLSKVFWEKKYLKCFCFSQSWNKTSEKRQQGEKIDSHTLDLTCLTSSLYLRFHTQLLGFSAGSLTKTDTQFSQRAALTVKQSLWGESHRFSVTETHKQHHLNALMTDGHSWVPEGWCAESYTPVRTHTQGYTEMDV